MYFDIDQEYDKWKIDELLACDAIFLSGGNTYYFLNSLHKHNLIPVLQWFVEKGGVLLGVSAGSILMSKSIAITTIDEDIWGDQNTIGLQNLSSLGLNDFEFFPHFDKTDDEIIKRLKQYSKTSKLLIYACNDGDGIVINNENIQFFGEVMKIENGDIEVVG